MYETLATFANRNKEYIEKGSLYYNYAKYILNTTKLPDKHHTLITEIKQYHKKVKEEAMENTTVFTAEQLQQFYKYAYEAGSLGRLVCGGLNEMNPSTLSTDTAIALHKTMTVPTKEQNAL